MCECVVVGNEHDDCNFGINKGTHYVGMCVSVCEQGCL